jgi:Fic family protein
MEFLVDVNAKVVRLNTSLRGSRTGYLYGALLRSEGIASSAIEGYIASARQVALAELSGEGGSDTLAVARAVVSLRDATHELVGEDLTHDGIHRLHAELLPSLHSARPGYRRVQNWVSGRDLTAAQYVPPAWEEVEGYMADLIAYANESPDTPLLKAAVVHAQFESIHPYEDGNGRVGRALVHTVLMRGGLTDGPVVPLSAALRTRLREYVDGLSSYRYDGSERLEGLSDWVDEFAYCAGAATDAADLLHRRAATVQEEWNARLAPHRADALVHGVVPYLFDHPAVTADSLAQHFQVSRVTAHNAVHQLVEAGILQPARTKVSRAEAYVADDVLDLVTLTERQLASRDWDTLISAPLRHVPNLPERHPRRQPCGFWMERAQRACTNYAGHRGQHR